MANEKKIITLEHISAIATKVKTWANGMFALINHTHTAEDITDLATSLTDYDEVLPFGGVVNMPSGVNQGTTMGIGTILYNTASDSFIIRVQGASMSDISYFANWSNGPLYNQDKDAGRVYVYNGKTYVWKGTTVGSETTYTLEQTGNDRIYGLVGDCSTAAGTAAKVITLRDCDLSAPVEGMEIVVLFAATNTANSPTFNVNGWGAKNVYYNTAQITTANKEYAGYAGRLGRYMYIKISGSTYAWWFLGWSVERDTTYSVVTAANLKSSSHTTGGLITGQNLQSALDDYVASKISRVYQPKGSVTAISDLPALPVKTPVSGILYAEEGWVYNISAAFTTDDKFIEGAGKTYPAGTNVVCVENPDYDSTEGKPKCKWDVLAGSVDLSGYLLKSDLKKEFLDNTNNGSFVENVYYEGSGSGNNATDICYVDKQIKQGNSVISSAVEIHRTATIAEVNNAVDGVLNTAN